MANNNNEVKITFKAFNQEFNSSIREMDSESKRLRQEMKLQQEQMKHTATDTEKLEAKMNGLQQVYDVQQRKTRETAQALERAKELWGEHSEEVAKVEEKLKRYQIAEQQAANAVTETQQALERAQKAHENHEQSLKQLDNLLQVTGKSLGDFSDLLGQDLTRAIQNGAASTSELDKAFKEISRSALGADTDLQKIQQTLRNLNNGSSIAEVRKDLDQLKQDANTAQDSVADLGGELSGLGGIISGVGIAGAVATALDSASLETKIDVSFNVPESSIQSIKEAIVSVEKYGVDGEEALEGVRRQWALNKDASDETNATIVEGAGAIAKSYQGIDFIELIQETNEFASALGISNEEALAMTNSLLKFGFPPEQLDILSEYGTQMKEAGFSAAEVQAIFEKGVDLKSWNVDNLNDGVKEARLQMAGFGSDINDSTQAVLDSAGVSSDQFMKWGQAVAKGGAEGSKAMSEVVTYIDQMKDGAVKNDLATLVFGTKWEDQGQNMIAVFQGVADAQDKTTQNQNALNESIDRMNEDPVVILREAVGNMIIALQPLLTVVANVVGSFASWAAKNPEIAGTIVAITSAIGILVGAFAALGPALLGVVALFGGGSGATGLLGVFSKVGPIIAGLASKILPALRVAFGALTGPIGIAITILTTAVPLIISNWEPISEFFKNLWNGIVNIFKTVGGAIVDFLKQNWQMILLVITGPIGILVKLIKDNWGAIKSTTVNVFNGVLNFLKSLWTSITATIKTFLVTIYNSVKEKFNSVKSTIGNIMNTVKDVVASGWNKAVNFLKNFNLLQIGKDLIAGLIKGIKEKAVEIYGAVKGVATNVLNTFTKIFDTHSPSKKTEQIGFWLDEGLAQGIDAKKKGEKAAKAKAEKIVKTFDSELGKLDKKYEVGNINTAVYTSELNKLKKKYKDIGGAQTDLQIKINKASEKAFNDELTRIDKLHEAGKIDDKAYVRRLKAIQTQYKHIANADVELQIKINKANEETLKDRFNADKKYYERKEKYANLSMKQELSLLKKIAQHYAKNSEERTHFEDLALDKQKQITDEKTKINEDYHKKVEDLNKQYLDGVQKLKDEEKKAFEDRQKALVNFAGLFEEVTSKDVSGQDLMQNLGSQVKTLQDWRRNLTELTSKGVDFSLIDQLREMGPQAASELAALNTLTEEELDLYVQLWREKNRLAKAQATAEMGPIKEETAQKIEELKQETSTQMAKYQNEWRKAMKEVVGSTSSELSQMPSIGASAISGLVEGMQSKKAELVTVAQEIANIVSSSLSNVSTNLKGKIGVNATTTANKQPLNEQVLNSKSNMGYSSANESAILNAIQSLAEKMNIQLQLETPVQIDGETIANKTFKYTSRLLYQNQSNKTRGSGRG
ncbi:hypothetical protein D1B33_07445 [Lysinibacillus yapensis]|uniref:Phage tail tape measure protein domain-containing protein n=1 Tax=Ureibacillus yapensis TaxID=2304605 RepID=A0A396SR90_9BACL|nr:hypothetical protein [Lysinibacillus yapensis]RHW38699.1 hypothetical protein D1B33_07445 [Lysinibacillus yapensis]